MNKNLVLKKLRKITVEDRNNGKTLVSLTDLKNIGISTGQEQVEATGKDGVKLAIFEIAKNAKITATSGTISMGYYELQLGEEIKTIKNKAGGVKVTETITTADGNTITLKNKAVGTPGNEVGFIYREERGAHGEAFAQHSTQSATQFKYDANSKTITLPTGKFQAGDKVIVDYFPKFTEVDKLVNSNNNYSKTGRVRIYAYFTDPCTDLDVPVQIVMERGKISGTMDLQFGDQAATQNIEIDALTDVCSEDQELFAIYIYDENNATD